MAQSDDKNKRILVVDDEDTLCEALCFNLEAEGYEAEAAHSAEEALSLDLSAYDLVVLDVMMGEISGVQLARIMKSNPATAAVPVIFCSARDSEDDIISGLDIGADDYITKPYSLREFLARIRSVLRRSAAHRQLKPREHDRLIYKGLSLSIPDKTCSVDGETVKLPRKEFEILRKLMSNPGHVFSREELLRDIWPGETVVLDRVVDVNITRIRQKIGAYGKNIVTRSGYGYGFVE
ncbi:MAG: response regulator transcription factor [Muribaculaceae bacterium]|nr:response regulator transcription factor [Muribaculaceae bacterium]